VAAQIPVISGEIGEDDGGQGLILDPYMAWADARGISYLAWTWNTWGCGGPVLISSFNGTPCPTFGSGYQAHLAALAGNPTPTLTPSPSPSPSPNPSTGPSQLLIGNKVIQPQTDSNPTGSAQAYSYIAGVSGTAASISLDVANPSTGSVQLGLYSSDVNGSPNGLLAAGTISAPIQGWNTVAISPTAIKAGAKYWIAILDLVGVVSYFDTNGSGTDAPMSSSAALKGLPTIWTSGQTWLAGPASVYVSASSRTPLPSPSPSPSANPSQSPSASPSPSLSPIPINNVPCAVTINGTQQSGMCSGTFTVH
jgi:hypothetical protein